MAKEDLKKLLSVLQRATGGDSDIEVEVTNLGMHQHDDEEGHFSGNAPVPEAQVLELKAACANYLIGHTAFKPGDLVTPRRGYSLNGAGKPHIVLEVLPVTTPDFQPSNTSYPGNPNYGARWNIRTASFATSDDGRKHAIVAYWSEAYQFEPYTGPVLADN